MRRTYATLDGMRGLAAIFVVLRHSYPFFGLPRVGESFLAVDLFFGLSGFVLAHAYSRRLDSDLSTQQFMFLRVIRLYPLALLALTLGAFAIGATLKPPFAPGLLGLAIGVGFGSLLLLAPGFSFNGVSPPMINDPTWSLFFEMIANVVMGVLWRWLKSPVLALICLASAAGLIIAVIQEGTLDTGYSWDTAWIGLARVGYSFFLGVLICRFQDRFPLKVSAWIVLGIEAVSLMVVPPETLRGAYDLLWVLVGFPLLIATAVQREPGRGIGIFQFLGVTSYAIYVLHVPLRRLMQYGLKGFLHRDLMMIDAPWSGFVFVILVCVTGWLADRYYDAPVRRWLSRKLQSTVGRRLKAPSQQRAL
jgi:peptidoglycan/LPS O-acetylase OafA/YrhL